jgi:VWFA-related protein
MRLLLAGALIATILLLAVAGASQAPGPRLRIVEPPDGDYVGAAIVIRLFLDPPSTPVQKMTFFADGVLVCTRETPPFECPWDPGPPPVKPHRFHVVAYLRGGSRISADSATKGLDKFVDSAEVTTKHVTVSVLDGSRFVKGLGKNDFRLFDDNVQRPITYFASGNLETQMVLAVDISDSMVDVIEDVKANVKRFLAALRPTDRVTILGFNENPFIVAASTMDRATQIKRIDRLGSWGMTALYEMLLKSFDLLGRQKGRLAIVAFTDGADTASRVAAAAVERRKETSDALVYMIGQGDAMKDANLKAVCDRLAQRSGGSAFFPRTIEALRETFDQILEELSNQYLLGFDPKTDSNLHRLRIEVKGGYQVRHMDAYRWKAQGPS